MLSCIFFIFTGSWSLCVCLGVRVYAHPNTHLWHALGCEYRCQDSLGHCVSLRKIKIQMCWSASILVCSTSVWSTTSAYAYTGLQVEFCTHCLFFWSISFLHSIWKRRRCWHNSKRSNLLGFEQTDIKLRVLDYVLNEQMQSSSHTHAHTRFGFDSLKM